ncbi:MAG: hypothetical protein ACTSR5_04260 [Promethearchaeota archaeon]
MRQVAIIGVGHTKFGRLQDKGLMGKTQTLVIKILIPFMLEL